MRVEIEGVGPIEFEDGTPIDVIEKTVKSLVAEKNPAQQRLNAMPSFARSLVGAGEAGLQAATGLGSTVLGGLAGMVDTALTSAGGGSGSPGDTVRKVQQFGTYQPRTTQGQTASEVLGFPMELYSKGVRWAGDQVRSGDSGGLRDFLGTTVDVGGESLPVALGGMAALRGAARSKPAPLTLKQETLKTAQKEGYTVPPSMADRPSWLEGTGGKIRTAQLHSANNAEVTAKIAARELGMPEGTTLTPKLLDEYRATLYQKGYIPLKQRKSALVADETYIDEIVSLPARAEEIRGSFPDAKIAGSEKVTELASGALQQRMTYSAAIERIRQLRFEAKKNFKAFDDPEKASLARAQKSAADSLESLIERNLKSSGDTADLTRFQMARQYIAKSHSVEDALNPATGAVSARDLAKSPYLTGGLKTAADFARAFPKAAQKPEIIGGTPPISPLDVSMGSLMGGSAALATGSPAGMMAAGLPLIRPLAAPMTLSPRIQNSLVRNPAPLPGELGALPLLADPALERKRRSLLP